MTGRKEKSKVKQCPLCGGTMKEGLATLPFLLGDKVIVIRDVPSEICSDCGEPFMKSSVAGAVEKLLDHLEELRSEVSIVYYKAA